MTSDVPPEPPGEDRLGAPDPVYDTEFSLFYKENMPSLVRFLRWHGVPLVEAADIAQETMAELYRYWPTVRTPSAWVRRVASRRWGRRIADGSAEQLFGDVDLELAGTPQLISADEILAYEQRHDVLCLLDTLPARQRQVLAWLFDGYTPKEIAEELQLTPETVRANLYKARRAIAVHLREEA
jgi:RNA polymerase sigma-70 factor (ECF subfamily)